MPVQPSLRDNALTTLETLKALLGIPEDDTSRDPILIQLINQASASIEKALGRKLKRQDYVEWQKGSGTQHLLVDQYPIVSVARIQQSGEIIDPMHYDYQQQAEIGVIYKDDGWTYYGYPYGLTGDPITGKRNIEVRYTAGYILPKDATQEEPSDLPADLEGLVLEMVQTIYGKLQTGGSAGLKSFAISDVRWEWATDTPEAWQTIIDNYKRYWL